MTTNTTNTKPLSKEKMIQALVRLSDFISTPVTLIMGGGGAMILAHKFPIATTDIDAIPKGIEMTSLSPFIHQIAIEQNIPGDWMNPYFSSFTYVLPSDYSSRLISVFKNRNLEVLALGKEDMLIMKCFAHRAKDIPHAKSLLKNGANIEMVYSHIEAHEKKNTPHAKQAKVFLEDLLEELNL